MNDAKYIERLIGDIINIEFYFRKDDLITQIQRKKTNL
jgi:hypothetical protein